MPTTLSAPIIRHSLVFHQQNCFALALIFFPFFFIIQNTRNNTLISYCIPQVAFPNNQRRRSETLTRGTTCSATETRIRDWSDCNGWQKPFGSPEGLHYANATRIANSRTAGCIIPLCVRQCRYCAAVHTRHLLPWPCSRENEMPAGRENAEKECEWEGRNDAYKLRSPVRRVFTPFTSAVLPTPQRPPWLIYRCGTRELSLPFSLFLRYRHS